MLHVALDRQSPLLKIDFGVEHVVAVIRKLLKRNHFGIRERLGKKLRTKQAAGRPVAETNSSRNQPVAHLRERKNAQRGDGCQFEELQATLPLEFLVFESSDHAGPSGKTPSVETGLARLTVC